MGTALFSIAKRLRTTLQSQKTRLPTARRYNTRPRRETPRPLTLLSALWPLLGQPSANLVPEIDRWIDKGNSVRPIDLHHIIKELRTRKRFAQALEVSEWMKNKSDIQFTEGDHAVQLDLIGSVHGISSAEDYFNSLPQKEKTEKAYGALLYCYVREHMVDKALEHMEEMKHRGFAFSPLTYNNIMCLYANIGQYEKVPSVLAEMSENGVIPNIFSYKICINSYGMRSDIESMETLLKEMERQPQIVMDWNTYTTVANIYVKLGFPDKAVLALKKAEKKIERRDGIAYNYLIALYAKLGDKSAIWRLWKLQKENCKKLINRDYTTMIGALVKIGELEEAGMLLKEWESNQEFLDFRVANVLLNAYKTNGLLEKAEALLDEFLKKGKKPTSHSWGIVAAGYAEKGEIEKAYKMMKNALCAYAPHIGWTPDHEIVKSILCYMGEKGDMKDVEAFIELLKVARPMDSDMYYALIRARYRAGKAFDDLLKGMKDDRIEENKDIKEILTSVEERRNKQTL